MSSPAFMAFLALGLLALAPAEAQVPEPPVILDVGPGCSPRDQICGTGLDHNCDGQASLCPGADADWDGAPDGEDCDPQNRLVYPGISVPCSASCGEGIRTCLPGGSFSACRCEPLCEAKGAGRCYYVSGFGGNDGNPGTFSQPLRTPLRLSSYYCPPTNPPGCRGDPRPHNHIALQAGDVVYFLSGIYDQSILYDGSRYGFVLRGTNGTPDAPIVFKAYPGAHPVFRPAVQAAGFWNFQSSHVLIEGIEITEAYQQGLRISESDSVEVRNMHIHNIDGFAHGNPAGLYLDGSTNLRIRNNLIHDNYDRTNVQTGGLKTENSRNVVLFRGGNIRIHHNVIYQTPPTSADKTGGCITYKHSSDLPGSRFEVDHNVFWNCFFHAVGSGSPGSRIHRNLILNSDFGIMLKNFGGPTNLSDNRVEHNTIIGSRGLSYMPSTGTSELGSLTYVGNVVVDNGRYDPNVGGILQIDPYGTNSMYEQVVTGGLLTIQNNCYHNTSETVRFGLFSNTNAPDRSQGGLYHFGTWKNFGYDQNSFVGDPQLDEDFVPRQAQCVGLGRYN